MSYQQQIVGATFLAHPVYHWLYDIAAASMKTCKEAAYGSVSVLVSRSTHITSCGGSYRSKYRESTPATATHTHTYLACV